MKNISKYYGNQKALSKISFSLKKGEIVGFLGPNGAGKSTLMKIICCYLSQDCGNIKVCNLNTKNEKLMVKSKKINQYLIKVEKVIWKKMLNLPLCVCAKFQNL